MGNYTVISDLRSWVLFPGKGEETTYLLGSVTADKYLVVSSEQHAVAVQIIECLRKGYSPQQIQESLHTQGIDTDVGQFCQLLRRKGLLFVEGETQASEQEQERRWADIFGHLRALSWDVFSISFESLQKFLDRTSRWFVFLLLVGVPLSTLLVILEGFHWDAMQEVVHAFRSGHNVLITLIVNGFAIPFFVLAHEMAHAVLAVQGGVYPKKLSFRWFLMVPYFSLQLPGLYTLPYKTRLLAIAGGPLADLLLGNLTFLLARFIEARWLWFLAFLNYSRFIFNVLPILPMTDGYALFSQAVFKEIDIRGRAGREFRRWRQRKPHHFRGKYVIFYLFNTGVALFILGSALWQLNAGLVRMVGSAWPVSLPLPIWALYILMGGTDLFLLYLLRKRLRILFAW